ncbi:MAG: DUF5916 domain-containing protein [Fidelibacterota bacterium]
MKIFKSLILVLLIIPQLSALHLNEKVTPAVRTQSAPKIDGQFNDEVWNNSPSLSNFIQVRPYNGMVPSKKTVVKTTYDSHAFYVIAKMFDEPDSIYCELGPRDSYTGISSDLFEIQISPYEDGNISYFFSVSASGVQSDLIYSPSGRDRSSNTVWESATSITSDGWIAEVRIPYSALRFPKKKMQDWGINFYRTIKRMEEKSSWSYVNNQIDQWWTQTGTMENLQKINPPLRLSLSPYVSGYLESNENGNGTSYNGGMDMKFGINESFTLDMTLIPDFGQVQSDDQFLNLSPFERKYSEKRQFFTEAAELFSKGNIFYSRRIGATPRFFYDVEDYLKPAEKVISNPDKTQMINATKLSGRTRNGLGIGFFNAMTKNSFATIMDTVTGETRKLKTQGFTNYNLLVVDQALKNNSYISFTNSNLKSSDYMADVMATQFRFFTKSRLYSLRGNGAVSNQYESDDHNQGFRYDISVGKTSGQLQYEYDFGVISDTFDPNDMGYLRRNNRIRHDMDISWRHYQPFSIFLSMYNGFSIDYNEQYKPKKFSEAQLRYSLHFTLQNHANAWLNLEWRPFERNNFYEPRVDGRYFKKPRGYSFSTGINTNSNKFYSVRLRGGLFKSYDSSRDQLWNHFNLTQQFKFSNRFNLNYQFRIVNDINDYGYVDYDDTAGIIYFGKRNVKSVTNTFNSNYMFSEKSSLNLRLRHYWSSAKYDRFFTLKENGYLAGNDNYNENADINFNALNIDMVYNWNFAPGSELSLVWKNAISLTGEEVIYDPLQNIENTFSSPQTNSISLKILYYLDYLNFKKYTNT